MSVLKFRQPLFQLWLSIGILYQGGTANNRFSLKKLER